ncbi:hypothetical protein AERYTH_16450 [Aeromicrobium erythreum]|uniref:Glycosyl transferase family 1 domain-containing protein n=1 Tax=Aeromicrobium erythreum TaxID=2041 RepID=A0A0U4CZZ9_9ACTN|nr:hypothetical protein AERYTH_16450 [Aeromicrobium erythreum]
MVAVDARRAGASGIGRYTQCLVEAFRFSEALRHRFELVELVNPSARMSQTQYPWDAALLSTWASNGLSQALKDVGAGLFIAPQYYVPPVDVVPLVRVLHDAQPFWGDFPSPSRDVFETLYGADVLLGLARELGVESAWLDRDSRSAVANLIQRMYEKGSESADELMTVSHFSATDLVRYLPQTKGRWHVAYPFVSSTLAPSNAPVPRGDPMIIGVSKMEPRKNQLALINAANRLRSEHPHLRLVLVGGATASFPAYADSVRQAARRADWVTLLEDASDALLADLYRSCDLFVSASVSEGFGFPGLEALEAGARVLVGSETSMREIYGSAASYFNESGLRAEEGSRAYRRALDHLYGAMRLALNRSMPIDGGISSRVLPTVETFGDDLLAVMERVL